MLDSVHLQIVLILMQDRCMICVEHTRGSEIILYAPNGTTRWRGSCVLVHLEIVLVSVQDKCRVCAKHTMGSEIILDAPDGTPK
jgi:hypothetical protein